MHLEVITICSSMNISSLSERLKASSCEIGREVAKLNSDN